MLKLMSKLVCFAALTTTAACSFHQRAPQDYRDDTRALLETRSAQIRQCYDDALVEQPGAAGTVAVKFTVQKDTGQIVDVQVDPAGTTAPPQLSQCVMQAVNGLALTPADNRDGLATFIYEFQASGPAAPPPPAAEPAPAT